MSKNKETRVTCEFTRHPGSVFVTPTILPPSAKVAMETPNWENAARDAAKAIVAAATPNTPQPESRQRVLPQNASKEALTSDSRKDFYEDLPRVRPIGGQYRVEIRSGLLMPSQWKGISEFVDVKSGEVLAHFAEFHEWHSIIPTRISERVARVAEASPLDITLFSINASIPFLRSVRPLLEGSQAMARVPIFKEVS